MHCALNIDELYSQGISKIYLSPAILIRFKVHRL